MWGHLILQDVKPHYTPILRCSTVCPDFRGDCSGQTSSDPEGHWAHFLRHRLRCCMCVAANLGVLVPDVDHTAGDPPPPLTLGCLIWDLAPEPGQENSRSSKIAQTGRPGYTLTIHTHRYRGRGYNDGLHSYTNKRSHRLFGLISSLSTYKSSILKPNTFHFNEIDL